MRPVGIAKVTKNNRNKHPQQRDEWMQGKKIGRRKQVWNPPNAEMLKEGYWEKI
jgi:hypothetical protein